MNVKRFISIIAIGIMIAAAVILLLLAFDEIKDLSLFGWLIILIILGILASLIALVVNSLSKIEKNTDVYSQFKMEHPISSNQNKSEEEKALDDFESGILDYGEYEERLKKIQQEEADLKKRKEFVDNSLSKLNDLLQAGALSSEEFKWEAVRICNEKKIPVPHHFIEKSIQDTVQDGSRTGKIIKLLELKDEGKITDEEFEEQISKL